MQSSSEVRRREGRPAARQLALWATCILAIPGAELVTAVSALAELGVPVRMTEGGGSHPVWSPDGSKIAFTRQGGIYVIPANDPGALPDLIVSNGSEPTWSPDGSQICYGAMSGGVPTVFVVSSTGGEAKELLAFARSPVWDPTDPDLIAYVTLPAGDLRILGIASGGGHALTTGSLGVQSPAWNEDDDRIYFHADDGPGYMLYSVAADSSSGIAGLRPGVWPAPRPVFGQLAFVTGTSDQTLHLCQNLLGSDCTLIAGTVTTTPAWSYDGLRLAYAAPPAPGELHEVYVMTEGETPVARTSWGKIKSAYAPKGGEHER